ncbi:E3 ubiquitin-ligase RNF216-like [Brachionus plicatilis]|uniref:E3 ubiquitin-ligase RNF216-like n=1 Tax=Brachionus plicatilis TaxID=10195 RepID=A0A3M7QM26_BRAPC|nr:E3 ubiquitin-ligase RNF216-like [Brachionus plicatilis]
MVSFKRSLSIEILDSVNAEQKKIKTESEPPDCIILDDDFDEKADEIVENLEETHFHKIASVITDCDPDFIREKLAIYSTIVANPVETIVNEILDAKTYPKIIDFLKKKKKQEHAQSALNKEYSIEELCKTYSDPIAFFNDQRRRRSDSYKMCSLIFLGNKFQHLSPISIENVLISVNYALVPAYHSLTEAFLPRENVLKMRCGTKLSVCFRHKYKSYKYLNKPNDVKPYPENLDEDFLRELWFIKNESSVTTLFFQQKTL